MGLNKIFWRRGDKSNAFLLGLSFPQNTRKFS